MALLAALTLVACAPLSPRPSADTAGALSSALPQSSPQALATLGTATPLPDDDRDLDSAAITRRVLLRHPELAAARARLDGVELEAWLQAQPAQPMLRLMPMLSEGRFRLEALLMQPLAQWLSRDLRRRLSEVDAQRASAELVDQVLNKVIEAQSAFHAAIVAEHHAELQTERVVLAQRQLDLVEARLRSGETEAAALIESRAMLARERAMSADSRRMRIDARAALAAALGEPSASGLRVPMQLPTLLQVLPSTPQPSVGSVSASISDVDVVADTSAPAEATAPAEAEAALHAPSLAEPSPEIEVARLNVESAELRRLLLDHWSSRWMPSAGVGGMRSSDMSEQRLELEVALPAYGRPDLEVERAGATAREAKALLDAAERSRALQAERALQAMEPAHYALRAARDAESQAERQQQLAQALLKRGESGLENTWAARLQQIDAERARMEAEAALLAEALELQRVLARFGKTAR